MFTVCVCLQYVYVCLLYVYVHAYGMCVFTVCVRSVYVMCVQSVYGVRDVYWMCVSTCSMCTLYECLRYVFDIGTGTTHTILPLTPTHPPSSHNKKNSRHHSSVSSLLLSVVHSKQHCVSRMDADIY